MHISTLICHMPAKTLAVMPYAKRLFLGYEPWNGVSYTEPESSIPSENSLGNCRGRRFKESLSRGLQERAKDATGSEGVGVAMKGRNVVGRAKMHDGKEEEIHTPASKQPGQCRSELSNGTAIQAAERKNGTGSDQDAIICFCYAECVCEKVHLWTRKC
jgi:hypothetical protein